MNSRVFIAALVGAIVYFLLGWIIYGVLLVEIMNEGMSDGAAGVTRENLYIWSFAIANFAFGLLLALLFFRIGIRTFAKGAIAGLWIGALLALMVDFTFYGQFDLFAMSIIPIDMILGAITAAITGGVIGWMLGMRNKQMAAA